MTEANELEPTEMDIPRIFSISERGENPIMPDPLIRLEDF